MLTVLVGAAAISVALNQGHGPATLQREVLLAVLASGALLLLIFAVYLQVVLLGLRKRVGRALRTFTDDQGGAEEFDRHLWDRRYLNLVLLGIAYQTCPKAGNRFFPLPLFLFVFLFDLIAIARVRG